MERLSSPGLFRRFPPGKPLPSEAKQIIVNVYSTLRMECPGESIRSIVEKCAKLTGVASSTVYGLKAEVKAHGGKPCPPRRSLFTPERCRARRKDQFDDFMVMNIRRKVHVFFMRNELPTLDKVRQAINDDPALPDLSRATVGRVMKDLGFRYLKRNRNAALIDREDIQASRRQYLRLIRRYRKEGRPIYFTDETWINAGHTKPKTWQDSTVTSSRQAFLSGLSTGLKAPSGKGSRLIITHAGNEMGFVEGALDVFCGRKRGDYHEEMDGPRFENWFQTKLLPNLSPNSVIVLDNAPYHSVRVEQIPNRSTRKADIQKWLTSKKIPWKEDMVVHELLQLVSSVRSRFEVYKVDRMAESAGHTVLRLPPYHCELNPIELIWSQVKGFVARENKLFTMAEIKRLLPEAIAQVTTDAWANCVRHVINHEEKRFWDLDGMVDDTVESLIINLNTDEESSE